MKTKSPTSITFTYTKQKIALSLTWFLVLSMVLAMSTSCSLYDVSYTMDKEQDFSHFKTFTWFSDGFSDSISGAFEVDAATLDSAIRNSIEQHLTSKGYVEGTYEQADLWINYQAIAETTTSNIYKYEIKDINQTYKTKLIRYSSSLDASRRFTTRYEMGTLMVDVIDRSSLRVIWRGSVETPLGLYNKEQPKIDRLNKAIHKMLAPFPSRTSP